MVDPQVEKNVAAKLSPKQQLAKTGKWFAGTQKKADMSQLKQLRKMYGSQGDITVSPDSSTWVLPSGQLIPRASSQRKLA